MSSADKSPEKTSDTASTQAPSSPSPAISGGGRTVQLKAALRGQDYATQVQMLAPDAGASGGKGASVKEAASHGMAGSGGALPYADRIQKSFGGYDISNVQAYSDAHAREGSAMMGASAYATGNNVVLGQGGTDLHTVAHEAAHVVQQRAGVSLSGGVGKVGDPYERHADAVADLVVQGKSAEGLLGEMAGGGGGGGQAQVQRQELEPSVGGFSSPKVEAPIGDDEGLKACDDANDVRTCIRIMEHLDEASSGVNALKLSMAAFESFLSQMMTQNAELASRRSETERNVAAASKSSKDPLDDALGVLDLLFTVMNGGVAFLAVARTLTATVAQGAHLAKGANAANKLMAPSPADTLTPALGAMNAELKKLGDGMNILSLAMVNATAIDLKARLDAVAGSFNMLGVNLRHASDPRDIPAGTSDRLASLEAGLAAVRNQASGLSVLLGAFKRQGSNSANLHPTSSDRKLLDALVALTKENGSRHGLSYLDVSTPVVSYDPFTESTSPLPDDVAKMLASSQPESLANVRPYLRFENRRKPIAIPLFGEAFELEPGQDALLEAAVAARSLPRGAYRRFDIVRVVGFGGKKDVDANVWNHPEARRAWIDEQHRLGVVPKPKPWERRL